MKAKKSSFFTKKRNFLFFKIFLWGSIGLLFTSFSILIPVSSDSTVKELGVFLLLVIAVNIHTSFLYPILSKKYKLGYILLLIGSVIICTVFELLLFFKDFDTTYHSIFNSKKIYIIFFGYIFIRNIALFIFFLWVEYFNRLILLFDEKEKIHQEEMLLVIEKQEFEKKFSRKKILPHYFFNILENYFSQSLIYNTDNEFFNKIKFVLYYFLVDAEKEKIELEKEIAFYNYYIELENLRHQNSVYVNVNILGQLNDCVIIPLLFEPLVGNAMKYTKHDGTGWVDITFDTTLFPVLKFYCKNNYSHCSSNIISSENGLKILEQRLKLCYNNKYSLSINCSDDLYEVTLSVEVI